MLNISDIVKAISGAKNRPQVQVAYLSAKLKKKTPDDRIRYSTYVGINMCFIHTCVCVY